MTTQRNHELTIVSAQNGFVVQAGSGQRVIKIPEDMQVARTPDELAKIVRDWAEHGWPEPGGDDQ